VEHDVGITVVELAGHVGGNSHNVELLYPPNEDAATHKNVETGTACQFSSKYSWKLGHKRGRVQEGNSVG